MTEPIEVPLTRGMVALIDAADAPLVTPFKWHANPASCGLFYARREVQVAGVRTRIVMHRAIMEPPAGMEVDHINGNGLDNRRSVNLRVCTVAENRRARRTQWDNEQGMKGVWREDWGAYRACIWIDGKTKHLGSFKSKSEAVAAYQAAAQEAFGAFYAYRPPQIPPEWGQTSVNGSGNVTSPLR